MLTALRFERLGPVTVATLSGDVDLANAADLEAHLMRAVTNEVLVVILDLSAADYFDSAGIRLLYAARERLRQRGQVLRIVVPAGSPARDALELAAVIDHLEVDESLEESVASAGGGGSPPTFPEGPIG